jgi:UDP-glucose 4-epimerase
MTASYLVTGGAGFIGNNIVRALLQRGDRVRVLDNFETGKHHNLSDIAEDVEVIEGDIRSIDQCHRAVKGMDYVLHQAAIPSVPRSIADPATTHAVNASGTVNMLIAARDAGVRRVVFASSSSVYGPEPKLPRVETDRPNPISPYAVSKLSAEQYCAAFWHSYQLETVALRYFNVFGPRQQWDNPYAAVVPRFVRAIQANTDVTIFGDGQQNRDFTYIDNVVQLNLLACHAPNAAGRVFNGGAGRQTSVLEMFALVCSAMEVTKEPVFAPMRVGDVRDSLADISQARSILKYDPKVGVEEGVRRTVEWNLAQTAA